MRDFFKTFKRMLKETRAFDKSFFWVFAAITISKGLLPIFLSIIPKLMVESFDRGLEAKATIIYYGTIYFVIAAIGMLVSSYLKEATASNRFDARFNLMGKMFVKVLNADYKYIVDENFWDQSREGFESLSSDMRGYQGALENFIDSGADVLSIIIFLIILGMLSPFVSLALALYICLFVYIELERTQLKLAMQKDENKHLRKLDYLYETTGALEYGKEIRIYDLGEDLMKRYKEAVVDYKNFLKSYKRKDFLYNSLAVLGLLGSSALAIWYLITGYRAGTVSSANFMMYLSSLISLGVLVETFTRRFCFYVISESKKTRTAFELLDSDLSHKGVLDIELNPPMEIEFKDLWFKYADDSPYVLKGLNLKINANETVALVGRNGAGKSTIIALLTGFYEPTKGQILLNGVDISKFSKKDLYTYFNGIFQNVNLFPLDLAHNVAMQENPDGKKVWQALEAVGLKEKFQALSTGLQTQILKGVYNDAVGLSGGEAQKVSISRAIYKDAPITLLDEPTAALDALAEYDIYTGLHKASDAKTSIYISHRLSSTKFCDRIVYLEDGKVLEEGTHDELLERDGEYARIFKIQGKYYQKENYQDEEI